MQLCYKPLLFYVAKKEDVPQIEKRGVPIFEAPISDSFGSTVDRVMLGFGFKKDFFDPIPIFDAYHSEAVKIIKKKLPGISPSILVTNNPEADISHLKATEKKNRDILGIMHECAPLFAKRLRGNNYVTDRGIPAKCFCRASPIDIPEEDERVDLKMIYTLRPFRDMVPLTTKQFEYNARKMFLDDPLVKEITEENFLQLEHTIDSGIAVHDLLSEKLKFEPRNYFSSKDLKQVNDHLNEVSSLQKIAQKSIDPRAPRIRVIFDDPLRYTARGCFENMTKVQHEMQKNFREITYLTDTYGANKNDIQQWYADLDACINASTILHENYIHEWSEEDLKNIATRIETEL